MTCVACKRYIQFKQLGVLARYTLQSVEWALGIVFGINNMGIDHRCLNIFMAQQCLDRAKVSACL